MQNRMLTMTGISCLLALATMAHAGDSIADKDMGLSKQSVFEVPTPETLTYKGGLPGTNPKYPRAYLNAPPQIPHNTEFMTPVTASTNFCMGCHGRAEKGRSSRQGLPTPIPSSHYTDYRHSPDKVGKKLVGARYVCTQCHVPQADAKPLVSNEF